MPWACDRGGVVVLGEGHEGASVGEGAEPAFHEVGMESLEVIVAELVDENGDDETRCFRCSVGDRGWSGLEERR